MTFISTIRLNATSFFFSRRRRHTRYWRDWSSDVCSSDLAFHSLTNYTWTWNLRLFDDQALLATHVNGAPLSANHGFPVRLIAPGYPGENRSEERRVGKECRSMWFTYHQDKR